MVANTGQDLGSLVVVKVIALDKAPAVDVDDHTLRTIIASQHVVSADHLFKTLRYPASPFPLLLTQVSNEANLFPIRVPPDNSVNDGRFSSFSVREGWPNSIDLDVFFIVDVDEFLIDVRSIRPRMIESLVYLAGFISNLRKT